MFIKKPVWTTKTQQCILFPPGQINWTTGVKTLWGKKSNNECTSGGREAGRGRRRGEVCKATNEVWTSTWMDEHTQTCIYTKSRTTTTAFNFSLLKGLKLPAAVLWLGEGSITNRSARPLLEDCLTDDLREEQRERSWFNAYCWKCMQHLEKSVCVSTFSSGLLSPV